jgi:hypothetical protein
VEFRDRLVATLRAAESILRVPGVLVVGSEVPNLMESGAAATLVVSQDVDVAVPLAAHATVKERLAQLRGLHPAEEEPSVWLPDSPDLIELNFLGMDPNGTDLTGAYVLEDAELPLMVFGALSLVHPGRVLDIDGVPVPLPRPAGLMLEKLLTDRTGAKGDRDLLVVAGMLVTASASDLGELESEYGRLEPELRYAVRSNLTVLSMMAPVDRMPDPTRQRATVAALLRALEASEATP